MLQVSEVFSSIQGEGQNIGRFATFVRFTGCNMDPLCTWCDTKGSQLPDEKNEMSVTEVVNRVQEEYNTLVVLTGGEPLIQKEIYEVINTLCNKAYEVSVETNGLLYPPNDRAHYVVSPKPEFKINKEVLKVFANADKDFIEENYIESEFKFVIGTVESFVEAMKLIQELNLYPVTFQPLNGDLNKMKEIVEWVEEFKTANVAQLPDVRVLPQLHKLIKVR
jgi:7-carboxy-7-deazaguanine synthase